MGLKIKIQGGYADKHRISLNDISKLSESIQSISKNYEIKNGKTVFTDIYISGTQEGCFEIFLDLIENEYVQGVFTGVATNYLTDLTKDMKNFILYTDKKNFIEKLINDVYELSIELADAEYYDYQLEKKRQLLEEKEKILNAEFSSFNSIKKISSLVKNSNEESSLKPDSISFNFIDNEQEEEFEFNLYTKQKIQTISNEKMSLDDIIVKGIPINISKESNPYFKMKVPFFGALKIYTTKVQINEISNYFKEDRAVEIKINPIVKMGELIKTKEARLIEIMQEKEIK
jgi:hypothetical protein